MNPRTLALLLVAPLACSAAAQDWIDDFDDGSVRDNSPVPWMGVEPLPALMSVDDGDLVLSVQVQGTIFIVAAAAVPIEFSNGLSVRARIRRVVEAGAAGVQSTGLEVNTGYITGVTSDGEVFLAR